MKSLQAIAAAYFSMIFLEGFTRIVIAFYHRIPFSFTGLESAPDLTWGIILLFVITLLGIFGAFLVTTIAPYDILKHILALSGAIFISRGLPVILQAQGDDLLFGLLVPICSIVGLVIGFYIRKDIGKETVNSEEG